MSRGGSKRRPGPVGPGPWRTCVGCRALRRPDDPDAGLVRFVRVNAASATGEPSNDGSAPPETHPQTALQVELSRHGQGRGAWVCRVVLPDGTEAAKPSCLAAATKRHAFAKALRITQ